jgi:hypothetical protein
MSAIDEADTALGEFVEKYCVCAYCAFWVKELFGTRCDGPDVKCGYLDDDTNTCEQHEFRDGNLQAQLEAIQKKWLNAWQIVEGFLYACGGVVK